MKALEEAYEGVYDDETPEQIKNRIKKDSNFEKLKIYLQWNGIHGYERYIYEIATGNSPPNS